MAPQRPAYSDLMRSLNAGKFTFTGEIEPEKIGSMEDVLEGGRKLLGHVVAANVTDIPQSFAYMNSLAPSYILQKEVGLEAVCQMTCRDRNRLALFADLLAAGALGLKNILSLTGDHPSLGDTPEAKPVFDLDSASLTYLIRKMTDEGKDLKGNEIEHPPKFHVGVAANPGAKPLEPEILKLERKESIGAEFIQTQVIYTIQEAQNFMNQIKHIKIPTLIGLCPLKSYKIAAWVSAYVPGMTVPDDLLKRMKELSKIEDKPTRKAKTYRLNVDYFSSLVREIRKTTDAAGCHIMAIGFEQIVKEIIAESGVRG